MIVSEPPSSMLRAAPKNFFGGYSAVESTPPDMIRPDVGAARLYARARRVMPSSTMTTSVPISTSRLARSIASSATCVCSSAGRSNVLATTSPRSTWRRMSVTSSGRSSTSSTMRCTSGLLRSIAYTSCLRIVVLPAFGGDTIEPALALADRRDEVDDPTGHLVRLVAELERQLRVGEQRREVFEPRAVARVVGRQAVDVVDTEERRVLLVARLRSRRAA